jgi:hypothetical protein
MKWLNETVSFVAETYTLDFIITIPIRAVAHLLSPLGMSLIGIGYLLWSDDEKSLSNNRPALTVLMGYSASVWYATNVNGRALVFAYFFGSVIAGYGFKKFLDNIRDLFDE